MALQSTLAKSSRLHCMGTLQRLFWHTTIPAANLNPALQINALRSGSRAPWRWWISGYLTTLSLATAAIALHKRVSCRLSYTVMSGGYQILQHLPYPADCIPQWGMVGTFSPHFFLPPPGPHTYFDIHKHICPRIPRGFHKGPIRVTCQRHLLILELLQSGTLWRTLAQGIGSAIPQSLYPPGATDKHSAIAIQSLITRTQM
jgi:hypothetical protein